MTPTIQSLGIDRLPVADRLRLMNDIWDTLVPGEFTVPDWHWEIIGQRLADADADPAGGSPVEEVMARLRAGQ